MWVELSVGGAADLAKQNAAYEQLKAAYPSKGRKHRTDEAEQT
jgi:hypothetical protein